MPDTTVILRAIISDFTAKMAVARGEMEKTSKAGTSHFSALSSGMAAAGTAVIGGAAAIGAASVKMAGDFQQNMEKLVTSGGELQSNLGADMAGVKKMMGETGTSASQLAAGLYTINSAGFHGAAGLEVLRAAAEGAKTENADLTEVTDGVTTMMNDYHQKASQAALVTSKMVEATSLGKTTFQDLAGSLHTVSPAADAAGISMNQVLGAMATMTAKGTPAADAATYLRQTILQLENPTQKASDEMAALGLSSIDVSQHLGQRGLTGTLTLLTDAIQSKMGPAGLVVLDSLKKSAKSTTDFQKTLANLPPAVQTQVAALANMVGGTKSMQAALELTGATMPTFQANVKKVADTTTEAGNHVKGWHDIQQTFNQKLSEGSQTVAAMGISLGQKLIPWIEKAITWISSMVTWMTKHKTVVKDVAIALGILAAAMAATAVVSFILENALTFGLGVALVALVAGVVWVATHWKQTWGDIKQWFDDAVKFLRSGLGTLGLLILGPLAPLALLALHWQQVWSGIKTVIHVVVSDLLGVFKSLGDKFFDLIQGILSAGSHLPFVGKYFKQANDAVKAAHQDFDQTMTQWATDARTFGNAVGDNFTGGAQLKLAEGMPKVKGAGTTMVAQTAKAMRFTAQQGGSQVGQDMGAGLAAGVNEAQNQATAAANLLVRRTLGAMEKSARTSSPSKATMEIGENMALGMMVGIENKKLAALKAAGQFATAMVSTIGGGAGAGQATGQAGGWAAAGQAMAASMYGWTGAEWTALNNVAMRESGWNPTAQNPTSSAYGIAQNIGGRAGYPDPSPAGQIAWMLAYIKSRYGDPIAAWQHELSAGWYDRGGLLPPGLSLAYNTTGRAEVVAPGSDYGMTVNVYVGGSVVTEQGIVNAIHTGLLEKQKRVPLGIKAS